MCLRDASRTWNSIGETVEREMHKYTRRPQDEISFCLFSSKTKKKLQMQFGMKFNIFLSRSHLKKLHTQISLKEWKRRHDTYSFAYFARLFFHFFSFIFASLLKPKRATTAQQQITRNIMQFSCWNTSIENDVAKMHFSYFFPLPQTRKLVFGVYLSIQGHDSIILLKCIIYFFISRNKSRENVGMWLMWRRCVDNSHHRLHFFQFRNDRRWFPFPNENESCAWSWTQHIRCFSVWFFFLGRNTNKGNVRKAYWGQQAEDRKHQMGAQTSEDSWYMIKLLIISFRKSQTLSVDSSESRIVEDSLELTQSQGKIHKFLSLK